MKTVPDLREVVVPKPKLRSLNAQLVPTYLAELAKNGVYYESRIV